MAMLEVERIHTYYGHIHALHDVSVNVEEGEIVTSSAPMVRARAPCSKPPAVC